MFQDRSYVLRVPGSRQDTQRPRMRLRTVENLVVGLEALCVGWGRLQTNYM